MDSSIFMSASLQPAHNRMFRCSKFLTWQDEGLVGNGLTLAAACMAREPINLDAPHTGHASLLLTTSCHRWSV
jgi:hypothetical protein